MIKKVIPNLEAIHVCSLVRGKKYECMEKIKVHVILQSWKSDTFMYSCHRYAEFFQLIFFGHR